MIIAVSDPCKPLPLAFDGAMQEDMVDPAHLLALEAIRRAGYEVNL